MIFPLDLQYKGNRTYVHGTDMLNQGISALTAHFKNTLHSIDFTIHRMTSHQLALYVTPLDLALSKQPDDVAYMTFQLGDASWKATWVEQLFEPTARYPYDEDNIKIHTLIDKAAKSIQLQVGSPFTPIETIVAMTKYLHQTLLPIEGGQWVFCRWTSDHWPWNHSLSELDIRLTQALGTKLTRCDVMQGKTKLGQIYFSTKASS